MRTLAWLLAAYAALGSVLVVPVVVLGQRSQSSECRVTPRTRWISAR